MIIITSPSSSSCTIITPSECSEVRYSSNKILLINHHHRLPCQKWNWLSILGWLLFIPIIFLQNWGGGGNLSKFQGPFWKYFGEHFCSSCLLSTIRLEKSSTDFISSRDSFQFIISNSIKTWYISTQIKIWITVWM